MMVKSMMREGYKFGKGLGKDGKGSVFPLQLTENKNRYGLGYRPTNLARLEDQKNHLM